MQVRVTVESGALDIISSWQLLTVWLLCLLTEFYGLDPNIMVKALRVLQRDSRADVFDGASPDEVAVKFRAAS